MVLGGNGGDAALTRDGEVYVATKRAQHVEPAPDEMQRHAVAISGSGANDGVCVLLDDNQVWCHGRIHGDLGFRSHKPKPKEEPQYHWERLLLDGKRKVVSLLGGMGEGCVVLEDGALQCWGVQWEARHKSAARNRPLTDTALGGRHVESLAFSGTHTCALFEGGEVGCWGEGSHGELGYVDARQNHCSGPLEDPSFHVPRFCHWHPPNEVLPLPAKAASVHVGQGLSCAILQNGELWCWGNIGKHIAFRDEVSANHWTERRFVRNENGGLVEKTGHNSTLPSSPMVMPKQCEPRSVRVGTDGFCMLCAPSCLRCWGWNLNDSLGYGDSRATAKPRENCVEL